MITTQKAYINGFVKRAKDYGYSSDDAVNILKQALDPQNTPNQAVDFASRLKDYGGRAANAMHSAGSGIEKLTSGWEDLQKTYDTLRGKPYASAPPTSGAPPTSMPPASMPPTSAPSNMLPISTAEPNKFHLGDSVSLGASPFSESRLSSISPTNLETSKNSLLYGNPISPNFSSVAAPAVKQENVREPSTAQLAKIMGSYNPGSRLDQAKAQRIRELFAQGKTSPNAIYADGGYRAITPQSLRR